MSTGSELESARAMVVNLEPFEPMVLVTMRPRPSRQVRRTRSGDHVSGQDCHSVRFLMSARGLRFRNLGFCGHDLIYVDSDLQCTCTDLPGGTRPFPAIS